MIIDSESEVIVATVLELSQDTEVRIIPWLSVLWMILQMNDAQTGRDLKVPIIDEAVSYDTDIIPKGGYDGLP